MNHQKKRGVLFAVLAAAFYALNSPLSKLLLNQIPATMLAGFLYLGAGLGMAVLQWAESRRGIAAHEQKLTVKELPSAGFIVALLVMIAGTYVVTTAENEMIKPSNADPAGI